MNQEWTGNLEPGRQSAGRLKEIDSALTRLDFERDRLVVQKRELKERLDREYYEFRKAEDKQTTGYSLLARLGKAGERVEKEREEAMAARREHEQTDRALADIERQIADLKAQREQLAASQSEYESLLAQKENLPGANGAEGSRIKQLRQTIASSQNNLKEIGEALIVGHRVSGGLDRALANLNSAQGWGTFDMLGGGLIANIAKHSNISKAKAETDSIEFLLNEFGKELTDLKIDTELRIDISGFSRFADFFFDGLIADWNMQRKINDSRDSVLTVKSKVDLILDQLDELSRKEAETIKKAEAEIEELLAQAPEDK